MRKLLPISVLLFFAVSCSTFKAVPNGTTEFRGIWIASVANIDWPKNGNDGLAKKKKDYLELLSFYKALNFNAAIVQIRTAGDALYPTKLAPWSRYLTGTEGNPPKDTTDILPWLIEQTHAHGMEFHAWLNPYRATMSLDTSTLAPTHDFYRHRNWMVPYGTKFYYNPGLPEVQEHLVSIMEEVVCRYQVDAIHFDDYFYPYTIKDEIFNDSLAYKAHALPNQSLAEWRRSNVDSLLKKVNVRIKNSKPWVHFGISPFGVWKNKTTDTKGSLTEAGQTTYENLFADPLLWDKEGYIDYLIPQLYWSLDYKPASYNILTDWWASNIENINIYIGNGPYKIYNNADKAWDNPLELPKQLNKTRATNRIDGNAFFSAKSLTTNKEIIVKTLKKKVYKHKALTPALSKLYEVTLPLKIAIKEVKKKDDGYIVEYVSDTDLKQVIYLKKPELTSKNIIGKQYLNPSDSFYVPRNIVKGKKKCYVVFRTKYGQPSQLIPINLTSTHEK